MSVGLAIIAKDEEERLPGLLASIAGAFDQVALLDTGSADRTVEVFTRWAERQSLPLGYRVGTFEWCDDFGAALNVAATLLDTDWDFRADADDLVVGAEYVRWVADAAPPTCVGVEVFYAYERDASGRLRDSHWMPRLTRHGAWKWRGRTWEEKLALREGTVGRVDSSVLRVEHRATAEDLELSRLRDVGTLARWLRDEPNDDLALKAAVDCVAAYDSLAPHVAGTETERDLGEIVAAAERASRG